ncbi:hypothetical protein HJC23_002182 [Cyclotella cryptica]|uniref:Uncharacterized protein n=1 Tax=Cyclotella cryptica TaxID=29204 RepID=A0ABD3Q7F0_9STRA|eukprot:CCRYP_008210-RA/>CCRYP_008210-RA protein AED:0.45 eAED:0.45 QI:0/-1/0/1/-1/1/1/0/228
MQKLFLNRLAYNGGTKSFPPLQWRPGTVTYSTTSRKTQEPSTRPSMASTQSWSDEWKSKGLGARLPKPGSLMTNLLFVQMGFGVDQHGNDDEKHGGSGQGATKAAVRAVRNAIEFNSIPGIIEAVPGGREEMFISVKLGVPTRRSSSDPMEVNLNEVAKVFPYGRLLPIETVVGGLSFHTGRIVRELGDIDDMAVCVAACVSIGYDSGERGDNESTMNHKQHDTKDGV